VQYALDIDFMLYKPEIELDQLVPITAPTLPAQVTAAGDHAGVRFLEFFTAQIRYPHTRPTYARTVGEFLPWRESVATWP